MAKKTSGAASKGRQKIHKVMKEKKEGTLKSGCGEKVTWTGLGGGSNPSAGPPSIP